MTHLHKVPTISIIMPSFNQGEFIEKAIQSVISQTATNWELIIIDGGSTDDTKDVVNRYKKYISHLISERDNGQADAIKKGFELSRGEILCWLNSDDIFWPHTVQMVTECMVQSQCDWAYGEGSKFVYSTRKNTFSEKNMYSTCGEHLNLGKRYRLFQPAVFFTRDIYFQSGGINVDLHFVLDWDLFKRFSNISTPKYLNVKLASAHIHNMQKSMPNNKNDLLKRGSEIFNLIDKGPKDTYYADFLLIYHIFRFTNALPWLFGRFGFFILLPLLILKSYNMKRIRNFIMAYKVLK